MCGRPDVTTTLLLSECLSRWAWPYLKEYFRVVGTETRVHGYRQIY
jgi:hypothetical protein